MNLNILLRGQSNAYLLNALGGTEAVRQQVQGLLGFDGLADTVTLIATADSTANTINSGTAFLTDWIAPASGGWT